MAGVRGGVRVCALLSALLLLYGGGYNSAHAAKIAYVQAVNFVQLSESSIYVNIVNATNINETIQLNFTKFIHLALPEENCPENYWKVVVTCADMMPHLMQELLFLDSSARNSTEYTLNIFGQCTNKTKPQLWINATSKWHSPPKLGIDKALLTLINRQSNPLDYSEKSDNCYKCSDYSLGTIRPGELIYYKADTTFPLTLTFRLQNTTGTIVCRKHHHYKEHSSFSIVVEKNEGTKPCTVNPLKMDTDENGYLSILYAAVIIIGIAVVWFGGSIIYRCLRDRSCFHFKRVDRLAARDLGTPKSMHRDGEREPLMKSTSSSLNASALIARGATDDSQAREGQKPKKHRLRSLDAFRGLSLTVMIFVNYGGGGFWFFNHSRWNGLTVADLVFPWFVWIMGVSIVFSYKGRKKDVFWSRLYQVFRRSIILFGLGLFLNNGFYVKHWRIPGVLQRFGITYFVVALTELFTAELYNRFKFTFWGPIRDITNNWIQWILILVLEFLWLVVTFIVHEEHCPRGYLGAGGLSLTEYDIHHNITDNNCTGGAAGYIDRLLFKEDHIYQHPTCKELYKTGPYDPEGALGAINSIVICYLGVQAGRILTHYKSHLGIMVRFAIWGTVLALLGTILCEGHKNSGFIPINKNLWSLSFILVMAGTGFLLLCLFYFLIDVIHWWNGSPFRYPGMNSIIVYVGSELLQEYFPFSWNHQQDSHLNFLAANLVGVCIWLIIAYYWYCIGFFVKI